MKDYDTKLNSLDSLSGKDSSFIPPNSTNQTVQYSIDTLYPRSGTKNKNLVTIPDCKYPLDDAIEFKYAKMRKFVVVLYRLDESGRTYDVRIKKGSNAEVDSYVLSRVKSMQCGDISYDRRVLDFLICDTIYVGSSY